MITMRQGFDINVLHQEGQSRWLKPTEVLFILQNYGTYQITEEPLQKPTSGSMFLINKKILRYFRKDGHTWRRKKDGKAVGEAHERLKVGNIEALNCYYAHGEDNPKFQRRCYWILNPAYEHIVFVHYRDVTKVLQGISNFGSIAQSPGSSLNFSQSPTSYTTPNPGSTSITSDLSELYNNFSSPGSIEVSSDTVTSNTGINHLEVVDRTVHHSTSPELEISQYFRRLKGQLSLDDESFKEISPLSIQDENPNDSSFLEYERNISVLEQYADLPNESEYSVHNQCDSGRSVIQNGSGDLVFLTNAGDSGKYHQQSLEHEYTVGSEVSLPWNEIMESCKSVSGVVDHERHLSTVDGHENASFSVRNQSAEEQEYNRLSNLDGNNIRSSSMLLPQEVENFQISRYSSVTKTPQINPDYDSMTFDGVQFGMPFEVDSGLSLAAKQKFTIQEISPDWGYANEATKVIIVGSFLCDPLESAWTCMFGDTEIPLQIIQQGVILCVAPPNQPGKVTLCITSGNRESCSEIREFEYRVKTSTSTHCNIPQVEATRSAAELCLIVSFVQMLLSDPLGQNKGGIGSGFHLPRRLKADNESWDHVRQSLSDGSGTPSGTINWLLEELLKDKLQQWISSRSHEAQDGPGYSLSKKEQEIIHMVAGMGFEWALNPILSHNVSINFRDSNGWTALHWAACFGREKMVAALIASGASAEAVTDPSSQNPTGKTAASIASANGHKGLAGYLSEVALTSHLSSLAVEESELSKGSAEVEAEITVNSISNGRLSSSDDQCSLKDTLTAVRNAAQAAARIQSAFRAHSFKKRQQWEAAADLAIIDEYGINPDGVRGLSALSKMAFGYARDYNLAALSIQKKYRGWKSRKDFLSFRQKVIKIQALVRGYQVRKNYKVICWAVGILDKAVLRWRRKGVGLRGFRNSTEPTDDSEDVDILKSFRKKKVDASVDEAVSQVMSMVDSSEARQQYLRMLEKHRQAKIELGITGDIVDTSLGDVSDMKNDPMHHFP